MLPSDVEPENEVETENQSNVDAQCDFIVKPQVCEKQVQVAKMFLVLRTKFNVTNSALNYVSAEISKILAEATKRPFPFPLLEDAFKNLNSQANRSAFYVKHFGYQSPKQLLSLQQ